MSETTFAYNGSNQLVATATGLAAATLHTLNANDPDSSEATGTSDSTGTLTIVISDIGGEADGASFSAWLEQGADAAFHVVATGVFVSGTEGNGDAGAAITWFYDGAHTVTATFDDASGTFTIEDGRAESATGGSPLALNVSTATSDPAIDVRIFHVSGAELSVNPDVATRIFTPGESGIGFDGRVPIVFTPYATTDELLAVLKVRQPTAAQIVSAQGVIDTATIEINAEIDLSATHDPLTAEQLELCNGVCIDRAADLWRHTQSQPGILGITDEGIPSVPGRYSFARYTARLSVLKDQWGIA